LQLLSGCFLVSAPPSLVSRVWAHNLWALCIDTPKEKTEVCVRTMCPTIVGHHYADDNYDDEWDDDGK
jgi:hypothetical protein